MANVNTTTGIDLFDGNGNGNGKTTSGNDTIAVLNGTANAGDVWNGGSGTDQLVLKSKFAKVVLNKVDVINVETLLGGKHNDTVTVAATQLGKFATIDLSRGRDTLNVSVGKNADISGLALANVVNTESVALTGIAGSDHLTLHGSQLGRFMSVDLGGGADLLSILSSSLPLNTMADWALANVEAISADRAAASVGIDLSLQTEGFRIAGSAFADVITGSAGDDAVEGGAGADTLNGGNGADTLDYRGSSKGVTIDLAAGSAKGGDAEGDTYSGFENAAGSNAADSLTGDANANTLSGNAGRDTLAGGAGADHLDGGAGQDNANYGASALGVTVNLILGTGLGGDAEGDTLTSIEVVTGSNFDDTLIGDDNVNALNGGLGNDVLTGNGGGDKLIGEKGNDTIDGGEGNDVIGGSDGNDVITGGAGADKILGGVGTDSLTGGSDADTFYFTTAAEAGRGSTGDVITDFVTGTDHVDLSLMDANRALKGDQAFVFIGNGAFTGQAGQLSYDQATGHLSGDVNGDKVANFTVNFGAGTALLGTDIIL